MPNSRQAVAGRARLFGSEEMNDLVARTAPAILALLGDGVPRSKGAIVSALAEQHLKEDVTRTLIRLAITHQLVEEGRKYSLPPGTPEPI